ncbi:homeobox protein vex1-like [Spea bombifrons]|uniref:homeobox protein vex1-like n=1 Tax=Spea bombifrons TaxID=233779 RepID=UPI00234AA630|nr:homeobox protein vex1-like [Spea bombifrons]
MEKRTYSVEWLSESSQKNPAQLHMDMDLLKHRVGHPAFQVQKIHHGPYSSCLSTPANVYSDKENYPRVDLLPEDKVATSRKLQHKSQEHEVLKEMSACRPSPSKDDLGSCESESTRSPGSISEEDSSSSRPRTKFSAEQLKELEKSFKDNRYIGSSEKKRLSRVLNLSETQIKTWFQNRRMKYKRQTQDARVDALFSRLYLPYYSYPDYQGSGGPVTPSPAALPFNPIHPAVRIPGLAPAAPIVSSANFGSYSSSPMLLRPMFNESIGQRYSPY